MDSGERTLLHREDLVRVERVEPRESPREERVAGHVPRAVAVPPPPAPVIRFRAPTSWLGARR